MSLSQNIINSISLKHSQSVSNTFVDKAIFEETLYTAHIQDASDIWSAKPTQNNPVAAVNGYLVKKVTLSSLVEDITVPNSQGWFLADRNPGFRLRMNGVNPISLDATNISNLMVYKLNGVQLVNGIDFVSHLPNGTISRLASGSIADQEIVYITFTMMTGEYKHITDIVPAFKYGINYSLKLYENNNTYIPSSRQPNDLTDGNNGWIIDYKAGYIYLTCAPVWNKPLKADFYYYIGGTILDQSYEINKIPVLEKKVNTHNHLVTDLGSGLGISIKQI